MGTRNKKSMNALFNKSRVRQAQPDARWALPSEMIGIEIEVENFERDVEDASMELRPEWVAHSDGSLRNGVEWVLSGPLSGADLFLAIDKFFDAEYEYSMSERTSVHLHVNASDDMSVDQFRNIFTLMYMIEPAVFRWADENRKWCGYCQPLTDFSPARLSEILNENDSEAAFSNAVRGTGNSDRYYGMNVASFAKHGTLEFRYFPCTKDKALLISWVQFVMEVKRTGLLFDGPDELLALFSTPESVTAFIQKYFTNTAEQLLQTLDTTDAAYRAEVLSAILETSCDDVRGSQRHREGQAETKSFQKLLMVKFNREVVKAPVRKVKVATAVAERQAALRMDESYWETADAPRVNSEYARQVAAMEEIRRASAAPPPPMPPSRVERPARQRVTNYANINFDDFRRTPTIRDLTPTEVAVARGDITTADIVNNTPAYQEYVRLRPTNR